MVWKGKCRTQRTTLYHIMKKAALSIIAFAFLLLSSSGCDSYSYNIFGSIEGTVTDAESGQPLRNAVITLVPGSSSTQTGEDGRFVFSDLDEGQYTVSVQKSGYQANRRNVTVISDETVSILVSLSVIPQ